MDEDPSQLVNQLGGFALDAFLSEFTGDKSIRASGLHAVTGAGGGSSVARNGVDASQIYNDRLFEDGTDGEGEGDDFEDEVDRELNAEDAAAAARSTASAMPPLPPSLALPKTRMRGEDDNFDDDDEDEDGDEADRASATRQGDVQLSGLFLPQAGESSLLGGFNAFPPLPMQIKQEELADERMHEDNEDPAEVAAQQALFQQSYARMQVAQQQLQPDDGYVGYIREPSPPAIDTATLYPSFAPHKVLNFTELFVPRPRKRARIDPTTELRA
jgi:transcription initiation factor TFIID subunit 1